MDKPFSFSVKVIILDTEGRCLLIKRSRNSRANRGKWEFPGGKLESGENMEQGLLREVAEETGLSIRLRAVAGAAEYELPERHVAYLIMEADRVKGKIRLSEEHSEYAWVNIKDLPKRDLAEQFLPFARTYAETRCRQDSGA